MVCLLQLLFSYIMSVYISFLYMFVVGGESVAYIR